MTGAVLPTRRVVLVTGLSGAGRASILHCLEDLGYEAVDNPPLPLIEELATRGDRPVAIGIDTRSRGFEPDAVLHVLGRLRLNPALRPELLFASAEEGVLIRRYTETRRRHPMAPEGRITEGILRELQLLAPLREQADMIIDTSDLPLSSLRSVIESRFGAGHGTATGMAVSLISFAYPRGLPRDADLVFDSRFLRNPHYDPILRPGTGLDGDVAAYVEADPHFAPFLQKVTDLLTLLLPRFLEEGKKYAGVAVGCTGGRHRSVFVVQRLAMWLNGFAERADLPLRVTITHRELARTDPAGVSGRGDVSLGGGHRVTGSSDTGGIAPAQAQEA